MLIRILMIVVCLLSFCLSIKAQFFQATLTQEENKLIISLVPVCGDITGISITQLDFFVESNAPSAFDITSVTTNTTNFPGSPSLSTTTTAISSGVQIIRFSSPPSANQGGRTEIYMSGVPYEIARIKLNNGIGTGDFSLIANDNDFSSFLNIIVADDDLSVIDATLRECSSNSGSIQITCPASCTADNYFTGDDLLTAAPNYSEGTSNVPLPAELTAFTANLKAETVILQWETAQEINVKGYEIERSMDGKTFIALGWVDGIGNRLEQSIYSYSDKSIKANNTYYYRLKILDLDSSFDYSPIVVLNTQGSGQEYLHINPNPASEWVNLDFTLLNKSDVNIELRQLSGELAYQTSKILEKGANRVELDANDLSAGIYTLIVHTEQSVFTKRLIIQ